jgi:hypothetical protein
MPRNVGNVSGYDKEPALASVGKGIRHKAEPMAMEVSSTIPYSPGLVSPGPRELKLLQDGVTGSASGAIWDYIIHTRIPDSFVIRIADQGSGHQLWWQ